MSNHASDLSKAEENLAQLKDNAAIEALMEERWFKAREKIEEEILKKKKEARKKEAAEVKRIADEGAAKSEANMISGWLKMFLGTTVGAGMLYGLWWKYSRSKRGSDATKARAFVTKSIKPNDGSGPKVHSSTIPSGGDVFNSIQTPSTIDAATTVVAAAGAAIMKQTTTEKRAQKGQWQQKLKQKLASVDSNSSGPAKAPAFDAEGANKKMWDEREKKLQEKRQEAAQNKQKLEEARKKEEVAAAEAKRLADKTAKQQKRLEAIKKVEQRKQNEPNEPKEKIEEDGPLQKVKRHQDLGVHEEDGGGNDGEMDVDALSWDQRLNAALDSVQDVLAGEVEETWV